jgi:hypothetical protein
VGCVEVWNKRVGSSLGARSAFGRRPTAAPKDDYVSGIDLASSETVTAQTHRELATAGAQLIGDMFPLLIDLSFGRHDDCHESAVGIEAEIKSQTMIDTRELYNSFVELLNLARSNPRAMDYLHVCLSKCSRAMQAIVAWDNKSTENVSAIDFGDMEYEC